MKGYGSSELVLGIEKPLIVVDIAGSAARMFLRGDVIGFYSKE